VVGCFAHSTLEEPQVKVQHLQCGKVSEDPVLLEQEHQAWGQEQRAQQWFLEPQGQ
jgi:hypothetical protein